jgi:signal transduction histidine kinase
VLVKPAMMDADSLRAKAGLDEASCRRRLTFLEFGPQDEANLREIRELLQGQVDDLVESFYAHLWKFEETRRILGNDAQVARLKGLQKAYFARLLEGKPDAEYFEGRLRVGDAHQRIGLEPQWYLGTYHLYLRLVTERLQRRCAEPVRLGQLIITLSKMIMLDLGLAIDAYILGGFVHSGLADEYRRMAEVAERTLREKAEIERVKADLTGMIVHDLKGPLSGILTVTQLAMRRRDPPAEVQHRRFEQIQRSARDLLRMIENILEIDQMEERRLELRVEAVDIGQLMAECADELHAAAELAGQLLAVEVADDVPVVATDRWLLRRVLTNLVVNAIRHSGATGHIYLAATYHKGLLRLQVRDQGRGIAEADQAGLFEKRGRSRDAHREDTGLGLVFCKMAVEAMGGTIEVASAPGRGATFTVTLPMSTGS